MASTKTYMLVPHHDFPADGPIRLGSIIVDPRDPGESLNEAEIPEIPPLSKHSSHKYNWEQTVDCMNNGNVGVWARCVNILGMGGSFGIGFDSVTVDHYRFDDLETTYFTPTQDYVEEAVRTPKVRLFLEGARYVPVYMVTGLKIVRGPGSQMISKRMRTQGGQANVELSGILRAGNFTIDAGDPSFRQGATTNTSFRGSSDFVIGYRLGKITFEKSAQEFQVPKYRQHVVGAVLGLGGGQKNQDLYLDNVMKIIFDGEEAVAHEFRGNSLPTITAIDEEDDKDCQCFIIPLLA